MADEKQKPIKVIKLFGVEVAEWERESADGKTYSSFSFQKSYKTKDGKWAHTTSFVLNDLPILISLISKVVDGKTLIVDPNTTTTKEESTTPEKPAQAEEDVPF